MDRNKLTEKLAKVQWLSVRYHLHNMREHGPLADATRGQGRVLAMLRAKPEISTRELSFILGIRPQSLSELLGKLEKGGYIVREQSEDDRRVIMVKLTEKGQDEKILRRSSGELFDCLTDEEAEVFEACIDKLIEQMTKTLEEEGGEPQMSWAGGFAGAPQRKPPGFGGGKMRGRPPLRRGFGAGFERHERSDEPEE